jgi:hypothetical protein
MVHFSLLPDSYITFNTVFVDSVYVEINSLEQLLKIEEYNECKCITASMFMNPDEQVTIHHKHQYHVEHCIDYTSDDTNTLLKNLSTFIGGFSKCMMATIESLFTGVDASLRNNKRVQRTFFISYCRKMFTCSLCKNKLYDNDDTDTCLYYTLSKLFKDEEKCMNELRTLLKRSKPLMTKNCNNMKRDGQCPIAENCIGLNPITVSNKFNF